jgi:hypothetical protein
MRTYTASSKQFVDLKQSKECFQLVNPGQLFYSTTIYKNRINRWELYAARNEKTPHTITVF